MAVIIAVLGLACGGGNKTQSEIDGGPPSATASANEASPTWQLPLPDLGYNAREGRALFRHYCATCHGAEGRGDGFNAFNLDPKPRDLSEEEFQGEKSDDELADVIMIGGGAAGLSTAMPPWGGTLSKRQVQNLVIYLRTLEPEL